MSWKIGPRWPKPALISVHDPREKKVNDSGRYILMVPSAYGLLGKKVENSVAGFAKVPTFRTLSSFIQSTGFATFCANLHGVLKSLLAAQVGPLGGRTYIL
jgi:hypothetical protein